MDSRTRSGIAKMEIGRKLSQPPVTAHHLCGVPNRQTLVRMSDASPRSSTATAKTDTGGAGVGFPSGNGSESATSVSASRRTGVGADSDTRRRDELRAAAVLA